MTTTDTVSACGRNCLRFQDTTRGRVTPVLHAFCGPSDHLLGSHHIGSHDRSAGGPGEEAAWRADMLRLVNGCQRDHVGECFPVTPPTNGA